LAQGSFGRPSPPAAPLFSGARGQRWGRGVILAPGMAGPRRALKVALHTAPRSLLAIGNPFCVLPLLVILAPTSWTPSGGPELLVAAQSQYFEVLQYRDPTQCERMQCMSVRSEYCREHLAGFYLREKGCEAPRICTNCVYGNSTVPTFCQCENPPFSQKATYGQACNSGYVCGEGEGYCFRPCHTYLHITQCPSSHCVWNTSSSPYRCDPKPEPATPVLWALLEAASPTAQGEQIVTMTSEDAFPISFESFRESSTGYRIHDIPLEDIIAPESMFVQLDENNDGFLSSDEYLKLPSVLRALDPGALAMSQAMQNAATPAPSERRLQDGSSAGAYVTPESCGALPGRKYYCSFDESCKDDCSECGWKSATDSAYSNCVRPTADACFADGEKVFCPSDQTCHPKGDCSRCVDRPTVDHSQHLCLALWWAKDPLPGWTNWVCRDRQKVGMPCRHDQDCTHGLRRCLAGKCQPMQPYNQNHTCETDFDCPQLNHYCPADPTGGENPYWVQYCRKQRMEGQTCTETRECGPEMLCNVAEASPRCRRLFSLSIGSLAMSDILCELGWKDRAGKCAPAAKSKEAGRSCDSDRDCRTTDRSGRTGRCVCKAWWDKDDSKYCEPVAGDYMNHQEKLRDYLWLRASRCGSFWSEEECLRVIGQEALRLKLAVECERQELSGGPYLPPQDCNLKDDARFADPCKQLAALR